MAEFDLYVKRLGDRIVSFRIKQGLSQIELASRMDIEDSALRRIEKGRTNPTLKTLLLLSKELNVKIVDLLSEDV